jgi:hypothetical protein
VEGGGCKESVKEVGDGRIYMYLFMKMEKWDLLKLFWNMAGWNKRMMEWMNFSITACKNLCKSHNVPTVQQCNKKENDKYRNKKIKVRCT